MNRSVDVMRPPQMRRRRGAGRRSAGAALLLLTAPAVAAGADVVEKVIAVVEDEAILLSEVNERFSILSAQGAFDAEDSTQAREIRQEILDQLINDKLLILEAESQKIEVSPDEVNQAVEQTISSIIEQMGGQAAFEDQLEREGLTESELRARYQEDARGQILANRLIGREIRSKVNVTDEDVRTFYEENRGELPKKPESYRLSDIFIAVRPDSLIEKKRREDAELIRQQILDGDLSFDEAAGTYSDDPSGEQGGDLGRFSPGDLDPVFEQAVAELSPGGLSEPVRTRFGYHIIRLDAVDPNGRWAEAHHILLGIAPSKVDEARALTRARSVKQRIIDGESFDAVAREVSDDPITAQEGGDLGWLPKEAFQGAVKEAVDTLSVGEIEIVPGDGGFHILKKTGAQEEGSYSFDEIRDRLREMVMSQRMEEAYGTWIEGLREKYFVEVHPLDF